MREYTETLPFREHSPSVNSQSASLAASLPLLDKKRDRAGYVRRWEQSLIVSSAKFSNVEYLLDGTSSAIASGND
ncbi:hypothetical protein [Coleofasciculus sp. FACHB-1120]|uniref:hypothetical protein n=1 Tax=Coleofasciculus sp. FACHB-1120 TaxID=2692783 RepID=UPI001A7E955C|nr:hypothetical protein [Coleofasciculus sp. FACHB-1120]